jgi:hypothetical protein
MSDMSLPTALERLNCALGMLGDSVKLLEQRLNDDRAKDGMSVREWNLRAEVSAAIAELDALLESGDG